MASIVAIVLGGATQAVAGRVVIAELKKNLGVGVGFGDLVEGEQTLLIWLTAPAGYLIDESQPRDNDGDKLWQPSAGRTEDAQQHWYEVTGLWPHHGHAVGFKGKLKISGPGKVKPFFDCAVADLDLDMDVLHVHQDAHWTPTNSEAEDKWEKTGGPLGGFLLPASLHIGSDFPATAAGTNYKILRVEVRPKWAGPAPQDMSEPNKVGTLSIFPPPGVAIYEPGGGARLGCRNGLFVVFESERVGIGDFGLGW